jgi:Cof subfamily protein (haloacid dehalogenase superfamily)
MINGRSQEEGSTMAGTTKAVFLDIDGTLLTSQAGPFAEDIEGMEAARRGGHRVFLSTGRSLAVIPPELREAPYIDGIIAGAGAHVILQGRTIYHTWIPEEILCAVCALYLSNGKDCAFEGETELYEIGWKAKHNVKNFQFRTIRESDDFIRKYPGAVVSKLSVGGPTTAEEAAFLGEYFHVYSQGAHSDCIIKGEGKAKGMQIILDAIGMNREDTIAIGDSSNDMDMIRFAGLGIAMGNACDELKAAAGAVTGNCGEGGVAQALDRYVLS